MKETPARARMSSAPSLPPGPTDPAEPLAFPYHYPPRSRWKRFFLGVRWLGPDLSFFRELERRQACRGAASLEQWPDDGRRAIAARAGEAFREQVGWRSAYFLPGDCFNVMVGGPRFKMLDDLGALDAIAGTEEAIGVSLPQRFWDTCDTLTFGQVVDAWHALPRARRRIDGAVRVP